MRQIIILEDIRQDGDDGPEIRQQAQTREGIWEIIQRRKRTEHYETLGHFQHFYEVA